MQRTELDSALEQSKKENGKGFLGRNLASLLRVKELYILLIIIGFGLIMTILTPNFLTLINLQSVAISFSLDAIMAAGMTLVIISGGIDLSVGSVLALAAVIMAKLHITLKWPLAFAVLSGLACAALIGLFAGFIISKLRIPNLIATLCTMVLARGLTTALSGGFWLSGFPEKFAFLGQGFISVLPVPFFIMLLIALIGQFLLRNTRYFQQYYFVGGNRNSAILSGILVGRVEIISFVICSVLSGLSGIIMASRLGMVSPTFGVGAELRVIAGCVIGGVTLGGGEGNILGALLGIVLLALVSNALILLNVSVYWQEVTYGIVLLVAVIIDSFRTKRA